MIGGIYNPPISVEAIDGSFGSTPALISPLALGLLYTSHLTFAVRIGTFGFCQE
jgi:hypothetical protein